MNKRSSLSNAHISVDKNGFAIEFPSAETKELALELSLLDMGLCDEYSLILPGHLLKFIKNRNMTLPSLRAKFSIVQDRLSLKRSQNQIGGLASFILQIYRDGLL